jgi:TRAP transporter 4TM/12TM fusion protein
LNRLIIVVAAAAAGFHLYTSGFTPMTALIQRPVHLALMSVLAFAGVGGRGKGPRSSLLRGLDVVLGAAAVFSCLYLVLEQDQLVLRAGTSTTLDLVAGALAVLVVLELARRTTGWGLVVIALLALAYGLAGPYLPGFLAHRGYGVTRLIQHLYLTTEGIWGVPLGVSADFVYLFVLFGAVLDTAGGGVMLIGLANRIAGRTRGGPAKTAAVASAIMGSLSGSAVANVVTTGSVTIPMMKRSGFSGRFAAAVEAAASTGGQIMPPVMGAGAFILATWTNIPYVQVAMAAAIPAILYYAALFMVVHFRAHKSNIPLPDESELQGSFKESVHLLVPLVIIVVFLAMGRSPMRAAFWGVISAGVMTSLVPATRLTLQGWGKALRGAGSGTVQVASACAAAGIVVGVASLTGIGLRMSDLVITLSGGRLPVALLLTALGSIVLGMGLPTTAAYVVLAALGAPALTELGVPLLSAHLFIFYFGCISNVTPPVALAAYAGAGIAGSPPFKTAVTAAGIAGAGYLVPFMFVYDPALLLDGSVVEIVMALGTGLMGMVILASAGVGFLRRVLRPLERGILLAGAAALFSPSLIADGIGFGLAAMVFVMTRVGPTNNEMEATT